MCVTCGCGDQRLSPVLDLSDGHFLPVEENVLAANARWADHNRTRLDEQSMLALNMMSSPGSGKTTLLVRTLEQLRDRLPVAVIEGDQHTNHDAERIRATGAPAVQINTGKGCHLNAQMVQKALDELSLVRGGILFIENVGNLVCPASFDLGERYKVVVLSVTEGDDKPLKYPDMFNAADLMIINKIDLLPYVCFDVEQCIANARRVKSWLEVKLVSAISGDGMEEWLNWLTDAHGKHAAATGISDDDDIEGLIPKFA